MIKNHTTGRNCQAVILRDSQFTHTIERKRDREREKEEEKKRDTIFMFRRPICDGHGHQFIVKNREAQGIDLHFL